MTTTISSATNLSFDKDFIKWDPKFSIGIAYIDEQHKQLIELCNKFYIEIMESRARYGNKDDSKWQASVAGTLKECVNYVAIHFSNEEKLMKLSSFDGYAAHKQRHDEFTTKTLEIAAGFDSMTFFDAVKFCKFLYDWIVSHIAHEDRLFVKTVIEYKKSLEK